MENIITGGYRKLTSNLGQGVRIDFWRDMICDEFVNLECETIKGGDFFGEIRGDVGVPDLKFSEVISDQQHVVRSGRQIAKTTEAEFLISFQIEDQGLVKQSGREAFLSPGSFALFDTTQPYSLTFKKPFHQFVLQIPKDVLARHLMNPEQYTAIPISGKSGLGAVLTNFLFSLARELQNVQHVPEDLSENLVDLMAMAFSSSVMLEQVGSQSIVRESLKRRIRQYIDNNLANPELSNAIIAQAQRISIRYLHKLFENEERTVHSLILNKRLQKARRLLHDAAYAGHSIERIAYISGFSNPAHFSRAFKKRFGTCPREIR